MVHVSRAHFERLVADALRSIPPDLRGALDNIEVVVDDWATDVHLEEAGLEPGDVLYGLYHGTPLPERRPHATEPTATAPPRVDLLSDLV